MLPILFLQSKEVVKCSLEGRIGSPQISGSSATSGNWDVKIPGPPYHHLQMLNKNSSWSHIIETLGQVRKACTAPGGGNDVCREGFSSKRALSRFPDEPRAMTGTEESQTFLNRILWWSMENRGSMSCFIHVLDCANIGSMLYNSTVSCTYCSCRLRNVADLLDLKIVPAKIPVFFLS